MRCRYLAEVSGYCAASAWNSAASCSTDEGVSAPAAVTSVAGAAEMAGVAGVTTVAVGAGAEADELVAGMAGGAGVTLVAGTGAEANELGAGVVVVVEAGGWVVARRVVEAKIVVVVGVAVEEDGGGGGAGGRVVGVGVGVNVVDVVVSGVGAGDWTEEEEEEDLVDDASSPLSFNWLRASPLKRPSHVSSDSSASSVTSLKLEGTVRVFETHMKPIVQSIAAPTTRAAVSDLHKDDLLRS